MRLENDRHTLLVLQVTRSGNGLVSEVHIFSPATTNTMNAIHGLPMASITNPVHEDTRAQHAAIAIYLLDERTNKEEKGVWAPSMRHKLAHPQADSGRNNNTYANGLPETYFRHHLDSCWYKSGPRKALV
jgi:hypothetical protein